MSDLECPYCGAEQSVDPDDCHKENVVHEQECTECEKTFGFTICVSVDYAPCVLPCANGGEHDLEDMCRPPPGHLVGRKRCKHCGWERPAY